MSLGTVILIVLVIILVGGISGPIFRTPIAYGYGWGNGSIGPLALIIIVLLVLIVMGRV